MKARNSRNTRTKVTEELEEIKEAPARQTVIPSPVPEGVVNEIELRHDLMAVSNKLH